MSTKKSKAGISISGEPLKLNDIEQVALGRIDVYLSAEAVPGIHRSRRVIDDIIARGQTVYGVNTGFGKLSDISIPRDELAALQLNLVRSHACGLGKPLAEREVRVMLLLRANVLAKGFSGVRLEVIELLLAMLNTGVHPVIPEKGSVGASGDLAPLAHLALTLIGEGKAFCQGVAMESADALRAAGLAPIKLEAKEGLALLNGTQALTSVGGLSLQHALRLVKLADVAGAMSLEALRGTPTAFDLRIHRARPHAGQIAAAQHLLALLEASEIRESHVSNDPRVQDAYCLRCMPQVHGAVRQALEHGKEVVEVESGSATDNPLVFADAPDVLSGGNFHGAPLALVFDYAAIALTDLMSISERRIDRLINPDINEGLPAFLSKHAGLSSGFMIAHVAAAALLNEAKVLAHPASVDSVPTSGGKEDHVSMGMTAALKLRQIVENVEYVLAIELLCAAQGLDFRLPLKPGRQIHEAYLLIREHIASLEADRALAGDIEQIASMIRNGDFDRWLDLSQ